MRIIKHKFQSFFINFQLFWVNQPKNDKNVKQRKKTILRYPSGSWPAFACWPALRSWQNLKKKHFFVCFQRFFLDFKCEWNPWKRFKINKKGWQQLKKVVRPAFGCAQHLKAGRNTKQIEHLYVSFGYKLQVFK